MSEKKSKNKKEPDFQLSSDVAVVDSVDSLLSPQHRGSMAETPILPLSYEEEITAKWSEIQRDQLKGLLLFPEDDVTMCKKQQEYRTEYCTVPPASKDATNLLVRECLKVFTCDHYVLEKKYRNYGGTYHLLDSNHIMKMQDSLSNHVFESDVGTDETDSVQDSMLVPTKESGIYKEGYLTKSPFHCDAVSASTSSFKQVVENASAKSYKRRWFTLKQTSNDGSYILEYRKEEGSAFAKGTLYLDSCTQIRKGVKGRMYGFELHIQEQIYSLAADSLNEMDTWIKALCRATGIELEQDKPMPTVVAGRVAKSKQHKNMRESLRNSHHPVLQDYAKESDQTNWKNRQENRLKIFSIYPDLHNTYGVPASQDEFVEPFRDKSGVQFVLKCNDFRFKLSIPDEKDSSLEHNIEPFYLSLALYDAREGKKLSEDFHCDLNDDNMKDMFKPDPLEEGSNGVTNHHHKDQEEVKNCFKPKTCVFSVDSPHPEIFLVLRVNKCLQGGIGTCAEPYFKSCELTKVAHKVQKAAALASKRLGRFQMPFAWAARALFKTDASGGKCDLDCNGEFTPIYKQEQNKLTDEEMLKFLNEIKSDVKFSKQALPGFFNCTIQHLQPNHPNCYSPSLIPLKPFSKSRDIEPSIEAQSFGQLKCKNSWHITPSTTYVNNFYVYPISLNYNSQKGMKARNILCSIQFRDCDEISTKPLQCMYIQNGTCQFTGEVMLPVLYHCTSPTFYTEVKIMLPPQLTPKHHLFFTFYHVSVEPPKQEKKKDITTMVGHAWMPLLTSNIVTGAQEEVQLPVAAFLAQNYLQNGPDIKWVDGKGQNLFRVKTKLVSTIYTQDVNINKFFTHWQSSAGKLSNVDTCRYLSQLNHDIDVNVTIKFLPAFLNTLFDVLLVANNSDVAQSVVRLLIKITSLMHEENKKDLLKSYIKYTFKATENREKKTVHGELTENLSFHLNLDGDPVTTDNILQHSWFFFGIMVKSVASKPAPDVKSAKPSCETKRTRFDASYLASLQSLVKVFTTQLVGRSKEKSLVAKEANLNLAAFMKDCLTHMDRGFIFKMINTIKDLYKDTDSLTYELKFEFLRCLCEHEHFICLNLPFDIRMKGEVHESSLTEAFCKRHFVVGLLLREVSSALYEPKNIRKFAIRVIRNLLVKHEFDDRYAAEEMQSRIAALYIPLLTTYLEHTLRFHQNPEPTVLEESNPPPSTPTPTSNPTSTPTSTLPTNSSGVFSSTPSSTVRNSTLSGGNVSLHSHNSSCPHTMSMTSFDADEAKELMICFLYILKNLRSVIIVDWWRDILTTPMKRRPSRETSYCMHGQKHFAKFLAVIDFFDLLECCIKMFQYPGTKTPEERVRFDRSSNIENTKLTLENKYSSLQRGGTSLLPLPHNSGHKRQLSAGNSLSKSSSFECSPDKRGILESNLSTEVSIVVLDMVELFCIHFKFHLEQEDGDNILMKKVFNVMMAFLRIGQSEYVLKCVFASLRSFIHKFPAVLFKGSASLCGTLCFEVLRLCNFKIESIREQACCFMYLLLRCNFEFSGTSCVRVHHQVIVAISKLIAKNLNRSHMNHSLVQLKNYATEDKGMKKTEFPSEVRDLIKKIHTVLLATAQIKEYQDDHEVLCDLQYSLAKSYASTPDLRHTWLESMAAIHESNGDYSEAAMCYIHSSALVAEYLRVKDCSTIGCTSFANISPNILPDENIAKDDEGDAGEMRYTEKDLLDLMNLSIEKLKLAERYEVISEVYKLVIPIYEEGRNFQELAKAYGTLKDAYDKIVEVRISGKRVLGRYYRVAFYGRSFKDSDGKEFVYKEPKLTSLPEISFRLKEKYEKKHGNVKLIHESSKVKLEELNPAVNYIQVTFVQPFFDEEEYKTRVTAFERENNIRRFVFETPFTLSGKAHGALVEQHKRKTILTTSHSFPYVKKRIIVVQQEQYELSPIEVAIDEMQNRVKELNSVIALDPPDMKKLQLKLAGSVSVQVNAGPLAYAETFLDSSVVKNYMSKHIEALQATYRDMVEACGKALEINRILIKPDQVAYQQDLEESYFSLKQKVSYYLAEEDGRSGTTTTLSSPTHSEA